MSKIARHYDLRLTAVCALLCLALPGLASAALTEPPVQPVAVHDVEQSLPSPGAVLASARRVADWQLAHREDFSHISVADASTRSPIRWQQAAFYIGLTHLAERTGDARYRDALLTQGRDNGWQLAPRVFHADDQAIGAAYLYDLRNGAPRDAIAPLRARADMIIDVAPADALDFTPGAPNAGCQRRWCWSDALFMAPPVWFELSRTTGDRRYAEYADREFRAVTTKLFDPHEKLYFRDSRFIGQRTPAGARIFWSRGNGWAFAGLARIIDLLPPRDPRRAYYIGMFRQMAARLIQLQKPDGYWAPSLLDNGPASPIETSGTAFFTYGLAWGVTRGVLDAATYQRPATRGWAALERAVDGDGMLAWVQQVGDKPDSVSAHDTQFYGAGAYLLAAVAMHDMAHGSGRTSMRTRTGAADATEE